MLDNTGFKPVVDNSDIRLDLLFVLPGQALPRSLPEHDLLMVVIGQATCPSPSGL